MKGSKKDFENSELVILNATQMKHLVAADDAAMSLSVSKLTDIQDKVDRRLGPSLVDAYSADFNPLCSGETRGMAILAQLRALKAGVILLRPVIEL